MKKNYIRAMVVAVVSVSLLTGFGLSDLKSKVKPDISKVKPDLEKCKGKKNSKDCKKNERLKTVGKVVAVGVTAKLIYEMAISFKSKQTTSEQKVISKYKKKHSSLPEAPLLTGYSSSLKPGEVVKAGKEVLIVSKLEVVPGKKNSKVSIKEKISIYDNEDHSKLLKSLTKEVNSKTKKTGAFKNEFKFTLPVGMPQGVYPIKTLVILDKKEQKLVNNKMQLVLEVNAHDEYRIIALNNY